MSNTMQFYTTDEIKKHDNINSCWLVAHGKVYDVTPWLKIHPARKESILKYAGTDATEHFNFHSKHAQNYWKTHQIGYVKGYRHCIIF